MEAIPVGVIIGLFNAITQKLPSFSEWNTTKHHHLLNSYPPVSDMMTEVRDIINANRKDSNPPLMYLYQSYGLTINRSSRQVPIYLTEAKRQSLITDMSDRWPANLSQDFLFGRVP